MIWLRRLCLLLLFANAGALMWNMWRPEMQGHVLPMTEAGTPGLILHLRSPRQAYGRSKAAVILRARAMVMRLRPILNSTLRYPC